MTLSKLLTPGLVQVKIVCASKDELITHLVKSIYVTDLKVPLPYEDLLEAIFKREQIGGTLFPSGLAVPHSRLGNYEDFILALGTSKEPIFHEGLQVRLMALMLSSQSGGPYYLPTVAALIKISRDGEYFSRLCNAGSTGDFISLLMERDQELG